jgi:RNA polymerase sigma-70 factor (ECF subfamily)
MSTPNPDYVIDLALLAAGARAADAPAIEADVLVLFDRWAPSLLRYASSFGLTADESEDVVQEVFLSLFKHLRLGRPQSNLKGWLFQVAHNLALRHRRRTRRRAGGPWDQAAAEQRADPSPDPEARLRGAERRRRMQSVIHALPERDRRCLQLRAEGLRYREIASTLGISLGAVAKALARSIARLVGATGE